MRRVHLWRKTSTAPRRFLAGAVVLALASVPGIASADWPLRGADPQNSRQVDIPGPVQPGLKWTSPLPGYEIDGSVGGAGTRAHGVVDAQGRLVTAMRKSGVLPAQYDLLFLDPSDGSVDLTVEDAGSACLPAVAEDGTVWTYLNVNTRTTADPDTPAPATSATAWLVSVDPTTGGIDTYYSGGGAAPPVVPCQSELTFGPDGSLLAFENSHGGSGTIRSIDPATGEPNWETVMRDQPEVINEGERLLVAPEGSPASPFGSAGAAYLHVMEEEATSERHLALYKVDLATGAVASTVDIPGSIWSSAHILGFVVDPGGGIIVTTRQDGDPTVQGHVMRIVDDGSDLAVDWTVEIDGSGGFKGMLSAMAVNGDHIVAWYSAVDEVVIFRWDDGSILRHHRPGGGDRTHDIVVDGNGYTYIASPLEVLSPNFRRVVRISEAKIPALLGVRSFGPLATDPAPSALALETSLLYVYNHGAADWLAFEPVHIDPRCYNANVICGTHEADDLAGSSAAELFIAGNGNDNISAGGGNDRILAGGGKDSALGGAGNDVLKGQGGADTLKGQGGKDKHIGGPGRDRCIGGPGRDTFKSCERKKQ